MFCEGELRALEGQNSILSKSRVNLGLPNAVARSPSPGLQLWGGLCPCSLLGQKLPELKREIPHPVFQPAEGSRPFLLCRAQSPREGANSCSASSPPAAAPSGSGHASSPPKNAALQLPQLPRVALGWPQVLVKGRAPAARPPNPPGELLFPARSRWFRSLRLLPAPRRELKSGTRSGRSWGQQG